MKYAYIDCGNILHIVEKEETAKEYAKGKIVKTDFPSRGGYPIAAFNGGKETEVIMYSATEYRVSGIGRKEVLPEKLVALYKACAGDVK